MKLRHFIICFLPIGQALWSQADYRELRETMVNTQLKARDIYQKATLDAMLKVPRHAFVPDDMKPHAYRDGPLPIGEGQTISQPYIVAFMTQALRLKKTDRVLEVGTGSGYQAAVLGEIVDSVFTIEIVKPLGLKARERLKSQGYRHVVVRIGDGYHGWKEKAPFNAIMVTAGAESIPEPLVEQLADGGRMIIPVGPHRGIRQLVLLSKKNGNIKRRNLMAVRFVPFTRQK
ncbi:MAG: protein-L-isoaspartate(D-aspartate) O-methyltransferase [Eudoraea sp.]|nr:protein-L-isoaspartate(D-aspartate) O-methyltransferase [Eudoraea sp.]NNK30660.1 protein-L-isoaspartate(D-aspartate) O-methyltransferase [Flavobacteriaceae bacterium]